MDSRKRSWSHATVASNPLDFGEEAEGEGGGKIRETRRRPSSIEFSTRYEAGSPVARDAPFRIP